MRKNIAVALLFIVCAFILCGAAMAGPIDNARQLQQKEVKTAVRGLSGTASQPKPGSIVTDEAPAEGQPAAEQPVEEEKIKIEISEKEIDARVPSYKKNLKEIIRDAETNINRIDGQLKAEDAQRSAKERYDKGTAFYSEGKYEEAGKEWNAALGLAKDLEFRKRIRGSLKRAGRQIREAEEKREAEEWAKKKAELKEKHDARRENVK